jgi:hypothetical protein
MDKTYRSFIVLSVIVDRGKHGQAREIVEGQVESNRPGRVEQILQQEKVHVTRESAKQVKKGTVFQQDIVQWTRLSQVETTDTFQCQVETVVNVSIATTRLIDREFPGARLDVGENDVGPDRAARDVKLVDLLRDLFDDPPLALMRPVRVRDGIAA